MRPTTLAILAFAASTLPLVAQETKPVPKDSVRVSVRGCTKGYVFTAARRTEEEPGSFEITEGMHLRMNGPKKLMSEIKAHEGSMIVITGLMKKGQFREGVAVGGGVTIGPGSRSGGIPSPGADQSFIDVEGWRATEGSCPAR